MELYMRLIKRKVCKMSAAKKKHTRHTMIMSCIRVCVCVRVCKCVCEAASNEVASGIKVDSDPPVNSFFFPRILFRNEAKELNSI